MSVAPDALEGCPVCDSPRREPVLTLPCGRFDGSTLYPVLRLVRCGACGHFFNALSRAELDGLDRYYEGEYASVNLNGAASHGEGSYGPLFAAVSPHLPPDAEILDLGCGAGGLLNFLAKRGFNRLVGVEKLEAYALEARRRTPYPIELGDAEALPFADRRFDVVLLEQVLEHVVHPVKALREARRVLRPGGICCIGVPDAGRYGSCYFFDFYWLLIREHLQHFDGDHLRLLAAREGFELLDQRQTAFALMSERMVMPNLCTILRATERPAAVTLAPAPGRELEEYIEAETSRRAARARAIGEIASTGRPVYAWGIGREFLYLFEAARLKECRLAGLIDGNPLKRRDFSVASVRITDERVLSQAPSDSMLLITAVAHRDPIERAARSLGYGGEIFDLDA